MKEEFKACPSLPGYEISNLGRVRNIKTGKFLSQNRWSDHYARVVIIKPVHRLVLEAFVGECPDKMLACHNDGDKRNNNLDNLRWDTPKANYQDRIKHGTSVRGEGHPRSKLTEQDVIMIRQRHESGVMSLKQLAEWYKVTWQTIHDIVNRKRWKHVD